MALEIQNQTIVGKIDNLQEKLNGELPINRLELLYLVNSWGRTSSFDTNENIKIPQSKSKECYDLSKLDTSEITDMSQLFAYSMFNDIHSTNGIGLHNGDISNWDVSNVTDMYKMFAVAYNFNQDINNWNVSNVTNMSLMFYNTNNFNQPLNNWDVSNVTNMAWMFEDAWAFKTKFNNGNSLSEYTSDLKKWLKENRDMMLAIDVKEREKDNLDSFYNNLESLYNNLDKENRN